MVKINEGKQGMLMDREGEDLSLVGLEQPWLRLPGEGAKWYSRFEIYLSMGPERNVHMACQKVRRERVEITRMDGWTPRYASAGRWYQVSRRWCWQERAEAWDEYRRQHAARRDEQRRIEERETRIRIITQQLHIADMALLAAQLDSLDIEKARALLPNLIRYLELMLDQHRSNLEPLPTYEANRLERELSPFTGDELAAAAKELAENEFWGLGREGDDDR